MKQKQALSVFLLLKRMFTSFLVCAFFEETKASADSDKIPLYIGGMFSLSGGWDGSGCLVAAELALEQINNRSDILPDYELKMVWNDTKCDKGISPRVLYNQLFEDPPKIILLGPSCSPEVALASLTSRYWNLLTVVHTATATSLTDRSKYPNIYLTNPISRDIFNGPVIHLMKTYGWRILGFVHDGGDIFMELQQDLLNRLSTINGSAVVEDIAESAINQIERIKNKEIKIVLASLDDVRGRKLFCEAFKQGFYGPDIVWILPGWYRENWWLVPDDKVDCTTEELAEIVETSLALAIDVTGISKLNVTTVAGITPSEFLEEIKMRLLWPRYRGFTLNNYLAYTFDAVWSIGLMLNRTADKLKQKKSLKRLEDLTYFDDDQYELFFDAMAATDFEGASGHVNFLKGERLGSGSDLSQLRGSCQTGWHFYLRFCYKFRDDLRVNWFQAVTSCKEESSLLTDLASENEVSGLYDVWRTTGQTGTFTWSVGLRHIETSVADNNQRVLVDLENMTSARHVSGDSSHDCVFIDFGDNNSLKNGDCFEERAFICKSNAEFSPVPIAVYSILKDDMIWLDEIIWPGGNVPLDGPVPVPITTDYVERLIPGYLHILMTSFAASGIILVLTIVMCFIVCAGKRGSKKIVSVLDYVILMSCLLMYLSVIVSKSELLPALTDQQHLIMCEIHDIVASVGFSVGLSTLVGNIWFIYRATSFDNVDANMWEIYALIAASLIIDTILIVVLMVFYPQEIQITSLVTEVDTVDPHRMIQYYVAMCSSGNDVIPLLLAFADKVMLVLIGLFLSYEINQASQQLAETKRIIICIYNITLFGVCGLILKFLITDDPSNTFIFSSVLVICCTTVTLMVLFQFKVFSAIKNSGRDVNHEGSDGPISLQDFSISKGTSTSTLNLRLRGNVPKALLEENNRLRREYEYLKKLVEGPNTNRANRQYHL